MSELDFYGESESGDIWVQQFGYACVVHEWYPSQANKDEGDIAVLCEIRKDEVTSVFFWIELTYQTFHYITFYIITNT